ncbi:nuclear transport factor 2 family protein [Sneathiella limimaris]|uniref:nuclear transport factor 2 family protein n=1 Tax=Sneathiella limimaris TaxID=1964213 RepID=UPI00146E4CD3|nr:nuclear transport factor 2 family protein [Sneathiella limimaris]
MRTNEDIVFEFLNNLKNHEPERFISQLANDAEIHVCLGNQIHSDSYAATFIGKKGAHNLFNICRQFLKIKEFKPTDFHHEDHKMIVRGDLECVLTPNNEPWSSSWMQIWTFRNDLISKLRIFADFHTTANRTLPGLEKVIQERSQENYGNSH